MKIKENFRFFLKKAPAVWLCAAGVWLTSCGSQSMWQDTFYTMDTVVTLTLPEGCDTVALYDKALNAGVAYVAGAFFYPDGSHRNTMRLNFSFLDKSRMEEGVRLLASLL